MVTPEQGLLAFPHPVHHRPTTASDLVEQAGGQLVLEERLVGEHDTTVGLDDDVEGPQDGGRLGVRVEDSARGGQFPSTVEFRNQDFYRLADFGCGDSHRSGSLVPGPPKRSEQIRLSGPAGRVPGFRGDTGPKGEVQW